MMAGARIRIEIDDAAARAALGFPRTRGDGPLLVWNGERLP